MSATPRSEKRNCLSAAVVLGGLLACVVGASALAARGKVDPEKPVAPAAPKAVAQAAADWPLFRGNALQNGVASAALPGRLDVLWKFAAGQSIEGAPAVVNGVVYVGSMDGNLYALDLATGKQKWTYGASPIKAPASYRDGSVYVGDIDGVLHCVDAATGKKRWAFVTEGEIVGGANFAGDAVVFGSGDETLYCLSPRGEKRWTFKVPGGPVMATPAVVGDRTFVSGCDSTLHVIDTTNGKELSSVEIDGQTGATPAVAGEQLYVGTLSSNQVLGIDWKQGKVLWAFEADQAQPYYSSAAVTEKLVVVGSRDKRIRALDRATGKEVWGFATNGKVDCSPVVAGGRVYVGSFDKRLYVLDLATGKELQKIDLDDRVAGSPAVADGRLLIGTTRGTVYCLGAKQ